MLLTMCFTLGIVSSPHVVNYKEFEGVEMSNSPIDRAQRPPKVGAESVVLPTADGANPGHMGVTL